MLSRFFNKRAIVALGVVGALALAGTALAYFTSTGNGTGAASVGSATPYTVDVAAATGGPLYPGSGTDTITWTVQNTGSGSQSLSSTSAALATDDSGNVIDNVSGQPVNGCLASWFTVTQGSTGLPSDLSSGGTYSDGQATIVLNDSGIPQNACEGVSPELTVSAS